MRHEAVLAKNPRMALQVKTLARQLHVQGCRVAAVGRDVARLADVDAAVRTAADTTTPEGAAAVFASSVVARVGVSSPEAIAAAKGGVEAPVRSAVATCASRGVRVNAVAPGMTDTPMTAGMLRMPAMRDGAARQYPLGGVQRADEVAEVMAWLLGEGASRLTGQGIAVDGGFTTMRPLVK